MDDNGHPLLDDSRKVCNIEKYAGKNAYICSTVDAVHIDFHGSSDPKIVKLEVALVSGTRAT